MTASAFTIRWWADWRRAQTVAASLWISARDPDLAVKAVRELYAGTGDGEPLGEDDFVICAHEKTSIQARRCCHPTLPRGKARAMLARTRP
jgi:hypothetical protein